MAAAIPFVLGAGAMYQTSREKQKSAQLQSKVDDLEAKSAANQQDRSGDSSGSAKAYLSTLPVSKGFGKNQNTAKSFLLGM